MFSAETLRLIIDTSCAVVHYRPDHTRIFLAAGVPRDILESVPPPGNEEWGQTKREVAEHVIMRLAARPNDGGIGPLRRIVAQLTEWRNLATAKDPERARALVRQLNAEVSIQRERREHDNRERQLARAQIALAASPDNLSEFSKVADLNKTFVELTTWPNPQQRGYRFQELLYELFKVAGLRPGRPFRVEGEEIDGTFILDFENYLIEAKWQQAFVGAADLSAFSGKVERRIECTRGIFIAVNGFSSDGIQAFQRGKRPSIVLMDGIHLMQVLERHIHLKDLLRALFESAARTGQVYTPLPDLRLS